MRRYQVRDWVDVYHIQKCTITFALELGFTRRECSELAIVASELTSNILKYGPRGSIELAEAIEGERKGMAMTASDCGPPFRNLESAVLDGHDDQGPIDPLLLLKRKGMGGGLGAVIRLTHLFRVEPTAQGKQVFVVRYLQTRRA
jgi:anti-sigma regulatory factor (Ser/Thr protein kinase)